MTTMNATTNTTTTKMLTGATMQKKLLPYLLHTCDGCGTDHYQNEMFTVMDDIQLCRVCSRELMNRLSDRWTLGNIMNHEMTLEERNKINLERSKQYAWSAWK